MPSFRLTEKSQSMISMGCLGGLITILGMSQISFLMEIIVPILGNVFVGMALGIVYDNFVVKDSKRGLGVALLIIGFTGLLLRWDVIATLIFAISFGVGCHLHDIEQKPPES